MGRYRKEVVEKGGRAKISGRTTRPKKFLSLKLRFRRQETKFLIFELWFVEQKLLILLSMLQIIVMIYLLVVVVTLILHRRSSP